MCVFHNEADCSAFIQEADCSAFIQRLMWPEHRLYLPEIQPAQLVEHFLLNAERFWVQIRARYSGHYNNVVC